MAKKPMKKPDKGGTPKKITTPKKPGHSGPWGSDPAGAKKPKKLKR